MANGQRNKTFHGFIWLVVLPLMMMSQLTVCKEMHGQFLLRALRSIPAPTYATQAEVSLNDPMYAIDVPFLGKLSEVLNVGKFIRIHGYIPGDLTEFQINLCSDCSNGPLHLHIGARFLEGIVVRNSYEDKVWRNEDRDGGMPFSLKQEFDLQIEVTPEAYAISVDGLSTWKFAHRVPYSTVQYIEIKGGPVKVWKLEYVDKPPENVLPRQVSAEVSSELSAGVKGSPSAVFRKFTMTLKCECTPHD